MALIFRRGNHTIFRNAAQNFTAYRCSSNESTVDEGNEKLFRTNENVVRSQNQDQIGKFFTVDPKIIETFGSELNTQKNTKVINYFAPREWTERNKVFGESCVMVRKPALEIINCLNHTDFTKPAVRYVIYGRDGCGKSMTLSHILCYGYQENFVLLKLGWLKHWLTRYYEVAPSTYKPGRIDHIVNSNILLKHFKQANSDRLDKCVTHRDYTWSARDKIPAGSRLSDVVDLGCGRLNFAADALNVLIRELKLNSAAGNCRVMFLVDGVNCLFSDYTMIHREKRLFEPGPYWPDSDWMKNVAQVDECSVLYNLKKLLKNDWNNACIITTADRHAMVEKSDSQNAPWRGKVTQMTVETKSHLPFACLGDKGWEVMNPFYPVQVDKYNVDEMDSAVDYYLDKHWIRQECSTHNRRQELHFLTGRIPADVFKFSALY